MNTENTVITITISMAMVGCSLFGGGVDPCADGSPLQQDAQVASDCQACGQSPCPSGETGDGPEGPPGIDAWCWSEPSIARASGEALDCFESAGPAPNSAATVDRDTECTHLSPTWPVFGSALLPDVPARQFLCQVDTHLSNQVNGAFPNAQTLDGLRLCAAGPGYYHAHTWPSAGNPLGSDWVQHLFCIDQDADAGACSRGYASVLIEASGEYDPDGDGLVLSDTCTCAVDGDCQAGAVCTGGWQLDGLIPHPTLCLLDEGQGNGPAPDGPVVYGFESWAEGFDIAIGGSLRAPDVTVVLTGKALAAAWLRAGVFNDDQRFTVLDERAGVTVLLDYCGADALCSALGLSTGDELDLDAGSLVLDDEYIEAIATVRYLDGRVGSLTVMTE